MIHVFRAEWRKIRRPSLFIGTLISIVLVSALSSSVFFIVMDQPRRGNEVRVTKAMFEQASGLTLGFGNAGSLLGVVALCIFAAQMAQEYSLGTMRNLLVRQPRRITLLAGKYLAMASFAALLVVVSALVSVATSYIWASAKHIDTTLWGTSAAYHSLALTFINVLIATLGYGTIGIFLGILLRSPISSISIGLAWLLVVEGILAAVFTSSRKWLPGQLLSIVAAGGDSAVNYSRALTTSLIFLALALTAIGILFKRRDVSA
ncbi:ABC-2 family transporter protein [mine drainage metagenome]|uniref:ABC-2 family transporter protein n=1 Tax=mine drainage metagenome TaxID=410659 RepID=A0A1J5PSK7_9ZZZZ